MCFLTSLYIPQGRAKVKIPKTEAKDADILLPRCKRTAKQRAGSKQTELPDVQPAEDQIQLPSPGSSQAIRITVIWFRSQLTAQLAPYHLRLNDAVQDSYSRGLHSHDAEAVCDDSVVMVIASSWRKNLSALDRKKH